MGFFAAVLKETVFFFRRKNAGFRVLVFQILFTGVEALTIIATLSLGLGAIIVVQGLSILPQFGQGALIYTILIAVITRELGPILTAFIVAARSGTAITTELGTMVANHEIDAFIATGIDPISYLVVPRFVGVTVSLVVLNVYFNVFGLLGSFVVTQFVRPIGFGEYFSGLLGVLNMVDIFASIVKSIAFGAVIATVATYFGFKVESAQTEIPQMTIRSVGYNVTILMLVNAVLTIAYYL